MHAALRCNYYDAARCRSCTLLPVPYAEQLARKEAQARSAVGGAEAVEWLPAAASPESGFRNKAKMVVGGSPGRVRLGLRSAAGDTEDLTACPLYPPALRAAFPPIIEFIYRTEVPPYDVRRARGELKYVLLTVAEHSGESMLRFVLRSRDFLPRLEAELPRLARALPGCRVISANLQPEHKAIVEGDEEVLLAGGPFLPVRLNDIELLLPPGAFFQTNTWVAAALYRQARDWVLREQPANVLDLFCGIGGFALHVAGPDRDVLGVELSAGAVAAAQSAKRALQLERVRFESCDATALEPLPHADLVIVNPPRRGLGSALCASLEGSAASHVLYSSCSAASLSTDLGRLSSFRPKSARVLDMFPHTEHYECLVLLERRG